jgi:hypothetical protein
MGKKAGYREVIRAPFWLIAFIYFMLLSLVLAIWAALDDKSAINAFAISVVLGLLFIYRSKKVIEISSGELRIGRAHIPIELLGEVEVLDRKRFAHERTRGADPAAYLATTFWVSQGVKVRVLDERDPTPYWLISSNSGAALKQALES